MIINERVVCEGISVRRLQCLVLIMAGAVLLALLALLALMLRWIPLTG